MDEDENDRVEDAQSAFGYGRISVSDNSVFALRNKALNAGSPAEKIAALAEWLEAKKTMHLNTLLESGTPHEADIWNKAQIYAVEDVLAALGKK
jgi:hypothetical protein